MSKICLNKLPGNILVNCEIPVHGISEIYLMHAEDISIAIDSGGTISSVSFATGAKSYRIEGYKQNIQVTTATRSMDVSNKLDISVMFKLPTVLSGAVVNTGTIRSILTGKFCVLVITGSRAPYFVGDVSPLECSGLEYDSNANGQFATATLTVPEGSSGNYLRGISSATVTSIISKSA